MTRDYMIGLALSGLLHGGVVLVDHFFPKEKPTVQTGAMEAPLLTIIQKEPEPEIVEVEKSDEPAAPAPEVSPPRAPESYEPVAVDIFPQKPQPPSPPDITRIANVIAIPNNHGRPDGAGSRGDRIFNLDALDQPPAARFQAKPVYPFNMRRDGIQGDVLVGFIVDPQGQVRDVHAIRSTHRDFEPAAIQAVSKWKFRPGRKGKDYVNTRMQVPIVFTINEQG